MRLTTVTVMGETRIGIVENRVVRLLPRETGDMVSAIRAGRQKIERQAASSNETVALSDVKVLSPIQRFSRDILCTGWNYWKHFDESIGLREGQEVDRPSAPTFFTKSPHVTIGPYDDINFDPYLSAKWDFEAEIGLVIGKRCRNISLAEAPECVFGYFLANDVSCRDLQRRHGGQWLKGKSIDATMPMGPFIATPDEIELPETRLQLYLNGESMQDALAKQMAFDVPTLLSELSFGMTLDAGDILLTGTPAGIGNARDPQVFLKGGDQLVTMATGLGQMHNKLVLSDLHGNTDVASMSTA